MSADEVTALVSWPVERTPVLITMARCTGELVGLALALGVGADFTSPPVHVPEDPDEPLTLPQVRVSGQAPWMPPLWAGPQMLIMNQHEAWVNPSERPSGRRLLPLDELHVAGAKSHTWSRRRAYPWARWTLKVAGPDYEVDVAGQYLALAWLGHLAGWPALEPIMRIS